MRALLWLQVGILIFAIELKMIKHSGYSICASLNEFKVDKLPTILEDHPLLLFETRETNAESTGNNNYFSCLDFLNSV